MSDDVAGVNEVLKAETQIYRPPFRLRLREWTPFEEAAWLLGHALGFFPGFDDFATFRDKVGSMWSATPLGMALGDCLEKLRMADKLERRTEEKDFEYRWIATRR